ncbi:MAG: c-type cytochrome [Halobacteriovoraceae bacterium]|nr:c-type cytochrome [Halobacteriovoraceae bacterium]MCB9095107.1 c-type cytochrome [Halobacteriovoraceae bacterium]
MAFKRKILFLSLVIFSFYSCNDPVPNSNTKYKAFRKSASEGGEFAKVKSILSSKCATCHSKHGYYAEYSEEDWKNDSLISPGDPYGSILFQRINGGGMPPPGNPALSEDEMQAIESWITSLGGGGSGSGSGGPDIPDSTPEFEAAYSVIYERCLICHDTTTSYDNISSFRMENQTAWADSGLIESQDPNSSILFQKIRGSGAGSGDMPPVPLRDLSKDEVDAIYNWISKFEFTPGGGGTTGGNGGGGLDANQRRTAAINQIRTSCRGCHQTGNASGGFNLENVGGVNLIDPNATDAQWQAGTNGGGNPLAVAGNSGASYIFTVIRGSGGQPGDMPTNSTLNADQLGRIQTWLDMMGQP